MKKILFTLIIVLYSQSILSQGIDIGMGYSTQKYFSFELAYVTKSNLTIGYYMGFNMRPGTAGELYSTINWDEFSEDHYETGSYYDPLGLALGYIFKNFMATATIGFAKETVYRNCFDSYHILGNNGYYFKTVQGNERVTDIGGKIFYLIDYYDVMKWKIGFGYSTLQQLSFHTGLILSW